jgi:hypothetical protein
VKRSHLVVETYSIVQLRKTIKHVRNTQNVLRRSRQRLLDTSSSFKYDVPRQDALTSTPSGMAAYLQKLPQYYGAAALLAGDVGHRVSPAQLRKTKPEDINDGIFMRLGLAIVTIIFIVMASVSAPQSLQLAMLKLVVPTDDGVNVDVVEGPANVSSILVSASPLIFRLGTLLRCLFLRDEARNLVCDRLCFPPGTTLNIWTT